jgi:hypothetical protein
MTATTDLDHPGTEQPLPEHADVRSSIGGQHVATVLFVALLIALPVVLIVVPLGQAGGRGAVIPTLLSWAVLVYSAIRLGIFCWRRRTMWAEGVFWGFSYVWLGTAGVAQVSAGRNPLYTELSPTVQTTQFGMILLGFLALDGGRWLHGRVRRPEPAGAPRVLSRSRVLTLCVVTVVLTPVFVQTLGGLDTLFSNRDAIDTQLTDSGLYSDATNASGGTLVTLANVLPFACLLAIVCLWRARPDLRRDAALWLAFLAVVAVNVVLNNPVSNPRYWVLAILLALVLCVRTLERPSARVALMTVFVLSAILAFPYLDATRTDEFGSSAAAQGSNRPVDFLLDKTDYGSVTDVGVTVRYVEDHGHTWGYQLLGAALFWFPRNLWPDKPDNTAELLADQANFPNRNLDTPLWAEGYIDFGFVGTAAAMALFGFLVGAADTAVERATRDPGRFATPGLLVAVSFVGYESFLLRGSLLQAMAKIVFLCVVLVCLSRRPAREHDDSDVTALPRREMA